MADTTADAFGSFRLHPATGRRVQDGRAVALPPKSFLLLALFVANPGRLLLWAMPATASEGEAAISISVRGLIEREIERLPAAEVPLLGPSPL